MEELPKQISVQIGLIEHNSGLTEKIFREHLPEELTTFPRAPYLGDLYPKIDQHTYLTAT